MTNHPHRKAKVKNGQPIRFAIRDASTGKMVRNGHGEPVYIMAYTAKAAKRRASYCGARVMRLGGEYLTCTTQ
jgi:hypothetical protein